MDRSNFRVLLLLGDKTYIEFKDRALCSVFMNSCYGRLGKTIVEYQIVTGKEEHEEAFRRQKEEKERSSMCSVSILKIENGKYEICIKNGNIEAIRYGEKWLDLTNSPGSKMLIALVFESIEKDEQIEKLKLKIKELEKQVADVPMMSCGCIRAYP